MSDLVVQVKEYIMKIEVNLYQTNHEVSELTNVLKHT